ncbi:alpha/beta fold hydrolase [Rubrivirga sp.]|uniref:alpha/beta fold hydrolase n=1 Tax=Rubrivirga sp. TaxID=1885344 RepID=UPI003C71FF4E
MTTLPIRGADLAFHDEGDGFEVVVLGHGYLMTSRMWEHAAAALVGAGYRVVRPEWRGQGRSEVTADGYDPWALADDLLATLDALEVERFHYVGHSMGGYVGYRLALRAPDRVQSLLQIGTTSQAEKGAALRQYNVLLWVFRLFGVGAVYRRILPILYGPAYVADPARAGLRAEHRSWIASNARAGVYRAGRGIFGRDDVSGRLSEIEVPTLVATGTHDAPHPPEQGRTDAERMPNAEFRALEVGHTPPLEAPDATTALVLEWLARHRSDA